MNEQVITEPTSLIINWLWAPNIKIRNLEILLTSTYKNYWLILFPTYLIISNTIAVSSGVYKDVNKRISCRLIDYLKDLKNSIS